MTTIIKDVIESMIEQGYLVNYIIGTKEQIGFPDATLMMFELPTYRLLQETKEREYTLKYAVSQPSTQQDNDVEKMNFQLQYCDKINVLFMDMFERWQNSEGQQLIQITERVDIREFADLTLLQHPATGLYCEMRFKLIAPIHCTWKN
jgi:hypothetical protein